MPVSIQISEDIVKLLSEASSVTTGDLSDKLNNIYNLLCDLGQKIHITEVGVFISLEDKSPVSITNVDEKNGFPSKGVLLCKEYPETKEIELYIEKIRRYINILPDSNSVDINRMAAELEIPIPFLIEFFNKISDIAKKEQE